MPYRITELKLALQIAGFMKVEVKALPDSRMSGWILRAAKTT